MVCSWCHSSTRSRSGTAAPLGRRPTDTDSPFHRVARAATGAGAEPAGSPRGAGSGQRVVSQRPVWPVASLAVPASHGGASSFVRWGWGHCSFLGTLVDLRVQGLGLLVTCSQLCRVAAGPHGHRRLGAQHLLGLVHFGIPQRSLLSSVGFSPVETEVALGVADGQSCPLRVPLGWVTGGCSTRTAGLTLGRHWPSRPPSSVPWSHP